MGVAELEKEPLLISYEIFRPWFVQQLKIDINLLTDCISFFKNVDFFGASLMGDSQIRIKMATVLVLNDVIDCSCFATNTKKQRGCNFRFI